MRILLDTDIDTDCDDAGALAVLHALADRGVAEILGVVCSLPLPACAASVRVINRAYGRADIPVALVSEEAWARNPARATYAEHRARLEEQDMLYIDVLAREDDPAAKSPDAVDFYRRTLAAQPDGSVTIVAIGTLTALAALLRSTPDAISPLAGRALVAQKVDRLVSMARAEYPAGRDTFNWRMDPAAAATVVRDWPTPLAVQPAGEDVQTGQRFMAAAPAQHPVRRAYRLWLGGTGKNRPSWDQLTLLYALGQGGADAFFERPHLSLTFDADTGEHRWGPPADGPERIAVSLATSPLLLDATVEELMIASLRSGGTPVAASHAVDALYARLSPCRLCPRLCGVDRWGGEVGFCKIGAAAQVGSATAHFGEERALVGAGGSGTLFFAGCNLLCVFCQNEALSHGAAGLPRSPAQLAQMMLHLQAQGCANINLVTPTHVIPQIADALARARNDGMDLPVVYNCGGYESAETLRLLEGLIDIYMPDLKSLDADWCGRYLHAPDYPEIAQAALRAMHRQVGDLQTRDGVATRGLLVRHLVMPDRAADTRSVLDFLAGEISSHTFVNVMGQYRPCHEADRHPALNRRPAPREVMDAKAYACSLGLRVAE